MVTEVIKMFCIILIFFMPDYNHSGFNLIFLVCIVSTALSAAEARSSFQCKESVCR